MLSEFSSLLNNTNNFISIYDNNINENENEYILINSLILITSLLHLKFYK